MIRRILSRLKGGVSIQEELTSLKLRESFAAQGRIVGLYSYGCFDLSRFARGVVVGRYCSFSPSCRVHTRNHGTSFLGMNPYFYEPEFGVVTEDRIPFNRVEFSDDIWVGANAVILPSVGTIGRGAAIGAGAIVTRPVPPYAIVAGNPARIIRLRFDEATIAAIEETRWWELDPPALRDLISGNPKLAFSPREFFDG